MLPRAAPAHLARVLPQRRVRRLQVCPYLVAGLQGGGCWLGSGQLNTKAGPKGSSMSPRIGQLGAARKPVQAPPNRQPQQPVAALLPGSRCKRHRTASLSSLWQHCCQEAGASATEPPASAACGSTHLRLFPPDEAGQQRAQLVVPARRGRAGECRRGCTQPEAGAGAAGGTAGRACTGGRQGNSVRGALKPHTRAERSRAHSQPWAHQAEGGSAAPLTAGP